MEQSHKRQHILNGIGCLLKTDHAQTFTERKEVNKGWFYCCSIYARNHNIIMQETNTYIKINEEEKMKLKTCTKSIKMKLCQVETGSSKVLDNAKSIQKKPDMVF